MVIRVNSRERFTKNYTIHVGAHFSEDEAIKICFEIKVYLCTGPELLKPYITCCVGYNDKR